MLGIETSPIDWVLCRGPAHYLPVILQMGFMLHNVQVHSSQLILELSSYAMIVVLQFKVQSLTRTALPMNVVLGALVAIAPPKQQRASLQETVSLSTNNISDLCRSLQIFETDEHVIIKQTDCPPQHAKLLHFGRSIKVHRVDVNYCFVQWRTNKRTFFDGEYLRFQPMWAVHLGLACNEIQQFRLSALRKTHYWRLRQVGGGVLLLFVQSFITINNGELGVSAASYRQGYKEALKWVIKREQTTFHTKHVHWQMRNELLVNW